MSISSSILITRTQVSCIKIHLCFSSPENELHTHSLLSDNDDYASRSIPFISYLESSPEGETLCRNIHIKDDVKYEKDEQFSISLTTRTVSDLTAFLPGTKTIVIQDNDGEELTSAGVDGHVLHKCFHTLSHSLLLSRFQMCL